MANIINSPPYVEIHRDAIYMPINDHIPWDSDPSWGVYNSDGYLVEGAAYYRGPGKHLVGQSIWRDHSNVSFETALPGKYLYGGNIISHFGHFLLSTFSRFWLGLHEDLADYKIICHGVGTPEGWFSHPFIKDIFEHLGLRVENFVVFKRPTIIPKLILPRPAFEEGNFAHKTFAAWGNSAGDTITRKHNWPTSDAPVWLSKSELKNGVRRCLNELDLIPYLEAAGVEIVHPQRMHIIEQILLFKRKYVMGFAGSAFHASILSRPISNIIYISETLSVNSNYNLIDKVNNNKVSTLIADVEHVELPSSFFDSEFIIKDPKSLADKLLQTAGL